MRALVAVGTSQDVAWLGHLVALLPAGASELALVHVVDRGPRHEWEQARERFVARAPLRPERAASLAVAERERGEAVLARAEAAVRAAGYAGAVARHLLTGEPGHALVEAAATLGADLVGLRAREGPGPAPHGPRSVGHVARFVLDHVPCPVLLLRGV
ncbi:MAG TPA: universal stress protein [Chloroflexota bacterium]|jgi:nucleotide-binding universal stress UspA family protein